MMRAAILALALIASPAFAVQPDEVLPDPALEARARDTGERIPLAKVHGRAPARSKLSAAR